MQGAVIAARLPYLLAIVPLGLFGFFLFWTLPTTFDGMFDFAAYMRGSRALLDGLDPYQLAADPPFVYPPIFAIIVIPLALLPSAVSNVLFYGISVLCLAAAGIFILRLTSPSNSPEWPWIRYPLLATLALLYYPVWTNAKLGQTNTLIFLLTVASFWALRSRRGFLGGLLVALAASIKPTPLIFVVYAFEKRQIKYGFTAIGCFLFLQLLPAIVRPDLVWEYWTIVAPSLRDFNPSNNMSLTNVVRALDDNTNPSTIWIAMVSSIGMLGLPLVLGLRNSHVVLREWSLLMLGSAIFGPLVEHHHLVWLLLPSWLIIQQFVRQRNVTGIVIWLVGMVAMSQPFRIARLIEQVTELQLKPAGLEGGPVLAFGVIVLYLLLLFGRYDESTGRSGPSIVHPPNR